MTGVSTMNQARLFLITACCFLVLLVGMSSASAAAVAPSGPYILSITQSGDFSKQNSILQFDPHNVTNIFAIENFPYYENIIGRAYDPKNKRIFYYSESSEVLVYDAVTMNLTKVLPLSFSSIFATAFHYDPVRDRLWFGTPLEDGFEFAWIAANETSGSLTSAAVVSGQWMAQGDASALDYASRLFAAQMSDSNGDNYIVTINVDTLATSTPAAMDDICQDMHAIDVNGTSRFVCVTFTLNLLVVVDPITGAFSTQIAALPWFENPNPTATAVLRLPEEETSRYFAQLYGAWVYTFVEYDIRTGVMLHNSTIPVGQLPELAYCTYVSPGETRR